MPLLLRLDDPRALDPELVGGKAASLARLRQAGFPVLPGCCLTTKGLVALLAQIVPGPDGAAFRWRVELATLPPAVLRLLRGELEGLGNGSTGVFVVRSSAVGEDGHSRAFAGIHTSFIDIEAVGVPRAVSRCWASLFSGRAMAYRRASGVDGRPAGGVLVQPMLANAVTGVAFTCDPLTGNPDRVVVEPLPSDGSRSAPATFLRVEGDGAPVELVSIKRLEEGNRQPSEGGDLAQVARLALRVEGFFGAPQDVEWAWGAAGPVILQARPVTVRPTSGQQRAVWSNGNLKEIFPSPLTPLTRTLVAWGIRRAWEAYYAQIGFRLPPDLELFGLFGERLYFNFAAFQQILFDLYGVHPKEENLNMGGHQAEAFRPEARRTPWSVRLRRPLYLWRTRRQFTALPERAARECREIAAWVATRRQIHLEGISDAELARLLVELEAFSLPKAALHLLASHAAGMIHHLEGLTHRWLDRARWGDINELLIGLEQVKSAELAQAVLSLAALAQRDPHCQVFFTARAWTRKDIHEALAGTAFLEALEAFLAEYGHRGVEELELASPPWREEPSMLFEAIRQHVQAGDPIDAAKAASLRRQRREAATQRILAALSERGRLSRLSFRKRIFKGVLSEVQTYTGIRELTKHHVVMLQDEARRLCREAGRRLTAAGLLDSPDQVFFVEAEELFACLEQGRGGIELRERIAGRRAERERLARLRMPDAIEAAPRRLAESDDASSGGKYRGIPVSAGFVRGVARVLSHPSEVHRLGRGDILVVSALDPAWTVALLLAGGVVAEVGGVLSHAAIVARELGVPAVVNVAGVTRGIRDGDMIEVDGGRGEVAWLTPGIQGIEKSRSGMEG